jgi:hypothetical protein
VTPASFVPSFNEALYVFVQHTSFPEFKLIIPARRPAAARARPAASSDHQCEQAGALFQTERRRRMAIRRRGDVYRPSSSGVSYDGF